MVNDRRNLGREAARAAFQLRRALSIAREDVLNIYDVASSLGVEIRFLDKPSLEGMFLRDPHPTILLPCSTHRPRGRIAFTCAHELGHFQLGHGTRVDQYIAETPLSTTKTDEEFAADVFASTLLMPRQTILARFLAHGWELSNATSHAVFVVATELGVGYMALLTHVCFALELVDARWHHTLAKVAPKTIRADIVGREHETGLIFVDDSWPSIPVDLEVGDMLVTPFELSLSTSLLRDRGAHNGVRLYSAEQPGRQTVQFGESRSDVRIARRGFCGQFKYRYLDDPEDE